MTTALKEQCNTWCSSNISAGFLSLSLGPWVHLQTGSELHDRVFTLIGTNQPSISVLMAQYRVDALLNLFSGTDD
jgi:hypothetical protein